MLQRNPDNVVVGEAASGQEALERIAELHPDLLLLDISMPGLDGLSLAKLLKSQQPAPAVVFCTALADRALSAFDCDAIDYLVKPVRFERLEASLAKVRRLNPDLDSRNLLKSRVGGRTELIEVGQVICLLAEDKYTTVVHGRGQAVINNSLAELSNRYPDRFLRIHRNALVARDRIRGLEQSGRGAARVLLDGSELQPEVSRRNLPAVRQIIRAMT